MSCAFAAVGPQLEFRLFGLSTLEMFKVVFLDMYCMQCLHSKACILGSGLTLVLEHFGQYCKTRFSLGLVQEYCSSAFNNAGHYKPPSDTIWLNSLSCKRSTVNWMNLFKFDNGSISKFIAYVCILHLYPQLKNAFFVGLL